LPANIPILLSYDH